MSDETDWRKEYIALLEQVAAVFTSSPVTVELVTRRDLKRFADHFVGRIATALKNNRECEQALRNAVELLRRPI